MATPGFDRLRARLSAQEQPLIDRAADEQKALEIEGAALRQQLEQAITQMGAMGAPQLSRYPVPEAPDPMAMFMSLLGAGLAGGLQGNRQPLESRERTLGGIAQERSAATQANVGLSNQERISRHQMLVDAQLRRVNALAARADRLGAMEDATKFGKEALRLSDLRNKLFQTELGAAEADAAQKRTETEVSGRLYSSLLEKGMATEGLDDKDFAEFRASALGKFVDTKTGEVKKHNVPALMTSMVSVKKKGDTIDDWQRRIAADMQAFGLNAEAKKKVLSLAQGYAPILFPSEEGETETPPADTTPETTEEAPNMLIERVQAIVQEIDALRRPVSGGLAEPIKKQRVRKVRELNKELQQLQIKLRRQGYDFQLSAPEIEGTTVR